MDRLYSIGDVHEMTGISVSALRYYADMKIVCPAKIDRQTGYRYYDFDDIQRLKTVGYLKKAGFFPGGNYSGDGGSFGGRTAESDVGADGTDQKADESSERTYVHDGVADKSESGAGKRAGELQNSSETDGFAKSLDDGNAKGLPGGGFLPSDR